MTQHTRTDLTPKIVDSGVPLTSSPTLLEGAAPTPQAAEPDSQRPATTNPHAARTSTSCRNCGADAPEEYCPRCGQETTEHLPSAVEFVHEFVLHHFAAEGKLWRTLRALVLHPGRLTLEYLQGRKARYVLPLRLYLTTSVVFFVLMKLVNAHVGEAMQARFERAETAGKDITIIGLGSVSAVMHKDGIFTCDGPKWLCERLRTHAAASRAELNRRIAETPVELFEHLSGAMFVLLPLFALMLQLAFLKRTYGEHFLFALHLHSLWFLLMLVFLPSPPAWVQVLVLGFLVIYSFMALRAVYGASWLLTILKGAAITVAYIASLFVAMMVITVWIMIR
jgi:hypothetical protein